MTSTLAYASAVLLAGGPELLSEDQIDLDGITLTLE